MYITVSNRNFYTKLFREIRCHVAFEIKKKLGICKLAITFFGQIWFCTKFHPYIKINTSIEAAFHIY